mmetsp:Transcript_19517/g.48909  ORF Transcript_19517/g.48909 Transcript_19517/m.48909 type:complete len:230 (-) Transcript_19517:309-998(-)
MQQLPHPLLLLPPHPLLLLELVHLSLLPLHRNLGRLQLPRNLGLGVLLRRYLLLVVVLHVLELALQVGKVLLAGLRLLLSALERLVHHLRPALEALVLDLELAPRLLALVEHAAQLRHLVLVLAVHHVELADVPGAVVLVLLQEVARAPQLVAADGQLALQLMHAPPEAQDVAVGGRGDGARARREALPRLPDAPRHRVVGVLVRHGVAPGEGALVDLAAGAFEGHADL